MSDSTPSPFEEPKTSRWVWIVPSVLLHVVILVVWLNLPEPPPRQPGERKLTIDEEQAEDLQEFVEESNLEVLQANVTELQEIRARMERIRAERMERLQSFEGNMVQEAPQDVAKLVGQIAATQQKIIDLHLGMDETVRSIEAMVPGIRTTMEKNEAEGIRALVPLASLQEPLNPLSDQFEELNLQITSDLRTIEQRLEWVDDQQIQDRVTQFRSVLEQAEQAQNQAFRTVHDAYRGWPGRRIASVAADPEGTIETLQSFDQEVAEGTANAEQEREALEKAIAEAEQKLAGLKTRLAQEEETLKSIDGKKERDAWRKQQQVVRSIGSQRASLDRELRKDRQRLSRIGYRPNRGREKEVQRIRGQIQSFLKATVDHERLSSARTAYENVVRVAEALITFLEEPS